MNLRSFHVFFIVIAAVFLLMMGAWSWGYAQRHEGSMQTFSWLNFVSGILVGLYGFWFVRKSRAAS